MEFLNVGPLELFFILLLALIVFGPQDMVKYARRAGRWVNQVMHSPMWKSFMNTTQEIRSLPTKIMREANLEESLEEIRKNTQMPYDLQGLHSIDNRREQGQEEHRIAPEPKATNAEGDADPKADPAAPPDIPEQKS
ncbi:MAG: hypothetical protein GYA59_02945 [Chloroflexi bacterium]|nr:hypothetical protein [Chloroflexota bacterium]